MAIGPLLTSQSNTIGAQLELDRIRRDRERERLALIQQGMQGLLSAGQAGLGYLDRRAQEQKQAEQAEAGRRADLAKAKLTHGNELERLREAARLRREEQEAGRLFDREQSEIARKDERGRALAESFAEMDKQKRLAAENQQKADALEDYRAAQINLEMARLEKGDPTALQRAEADLMRAEAAVRNAATAEARLKLDERKAKAAGAKTGGQPKLAAPEQRRVIGARTSTGLLDDIEALQANPATRVGTGPIEGPTKRKLGLLFSNPERSTLQSMLDKLKLDLADALIKGVPSETDMARIDRMMPDIDKDDEPDFNAKLKAVRRELQRATEEITRGAGQAAPTAQPPSPQPAKATSGEPVSSTDLVWMTDGEERLQFEPGEVETMKGAGWSVFYPDKDPF